MNREPAVASKRRKIVLLIILLVLVPGALFLGVGSKNHYFTLPHLGRHEVNAPGDTAFFTVPPFRFTDENGQPFSDKDAAGKVLIVDFIFTRCTSICPRMSVQMQQLQLELDQPQYKDLLFLSHTVDPEHDTPAVLKEYAKRLQADSTRWKFLTGHAADIYRQGNLGYLLSAGTDSASAELFVHSPQFVLVDKQRHIRGMYDGTSTDAMRNLVTDLKMLFHEENARVHK
ncbi:MAG: SCO family protein [Flavobacteriales bacterium]|nr:SCO family protein [Flavobacteriales bacterium]MBP9080579.1 SCO family protein [Flavobacteriales bacterium]